MKKNLTKLFSIGFLCLSLYAFGQQKPITGQVIDSNGFPVQDAYVHVEGTENGVYTDENGNYTIQAKPGDIITIDFIGLESKSVKVDQANQYNVKLANGEKQINLEDLIVIGYGTSTSEALTGSASVVNKEELAKAPTVSIEKALQATTPGLQVASGSGAAGSGADIRIRGIGSLKAGSSPLWVVDGVVGAPIPNMEDVLSVTVLKDAAASSIYGSRAANGVILVSTKSGKNGRTNFDFQAKYSISSNTQNKFRLLNSAEFYKVSWQGLYAFAISQGASETEAAEYAHANLEAQAGRNPYDVAQPYDNNGNLVNGANLMLNQDWYDLVHRNGVTSQYDLSANGGNDKTKFYFSLGYYDQKGIVRPDFYSRYTAQANISNQVSDKLKIGFKTTLKRTSSEGVIDAGSGTSTGFAGFLYPNNVSLYQLDKDFNIVYGADGKPLYNWDNKVSRDYNPIGLAELNKFSSNSITAFASVNLNYQILKDLVFDTNFSSDYYNTKSNLFQTKEHGDGAGVGGSSRKDVDESLRYISSSTLTYDKTFKEKHNINALLGYEVEAYEYTSLTAAAKGYEFNFSDELSVGTEPRNVSSSTRENRMIGAFSRLNYNFDKKYYTSFSIRRDASSKFAPAKRWGTFWSASAAWRITQEEFLKNSKWLDNLKLKASYGTNGNAGIDPYLYLPLYSLGGNYNSASGLVHTQLSSPFLRWEKNIMVNAGVEFGLFGVLDGSVEWFTRASDDLLSDKPLPYSTGWASVAENIGGIKNTGVEITLNSTNIRTKDFEWTTNFNISHYKNEITSLSQKEIIRDDGKVWREGKDAYAWYMREYAGVDHNTGEAQWYTDVTDAAGNVTGREITKDYAKATRYVLGSSLPDFYGALTNTFSYKNFSLGVQFYFSVGGKIYDNLEAMTMKDGSEYGHQLNVKVLDAWRPDNRDSNIPQFIYNNTSQSNAFSSRFLYDASFLRLRNLSLNYDMPLDYVEKAGLQSVKLFINVENLYTFTKYEGLDPEQGLSGTSGFSKIPNVKTFTFGARLGF
ncbi:TonB-dependent receptor [Weeksellaceae bacterium TAE3-ERU29]|nr:TonB-dependent receptor [Weeksellaceae bacterium TAE3-ERU29]